MVSNLRTIDLNLLVILDAVITERQVTRAAQRLGLSQPAVSNALNRLRHLFKDELLIRTPNGMEPTPRALEIASPIKGILRQVGRIFDSNIQFQPETTTRTFVIRMSDYLQLLLLPKLHQLTAGDAPGIKFEVTQLPPQRTVEALEADEIDLAVSTGLQLPSTISSETLFQDQIVCVMSSSHPAAKSDLDLETFLALSQVKVSLSPTDTRFVDDTLAHMDRTRNVVLTVPNWLIVPYLLRRSELVCTMPLLMATNIADERLLVRPLPFKSEQFDFSVYWHRRHHNDRGVTWLRGLLQEAANAIQTNYTKGHDA